MWPLIFERNKKAIRTVRLKYLFNASIQNGGLKHLWISTLSNGYAKAMFVSDEVSHDRGSCKVIGLSASKTKLRQNVL